MAVKFILHCLQAGIMPALRQAEGRYMWKEVVKLLPYGCFINIHMLNTFIRAISSSKCKGPSSPSWGIVVAYIGVRSWKLAQKSGKHIMLDSPWRITLLPTYLALGFRHAINLEPGSHHSPAHLGSCSEQTQCNYLSQIAAQLQGKGRRRMGNKTPPVELRSGLCSCSKLPLQHHGRLNDTLAALWGTTSHGKCCCLHWDMALGTEEEEEEEEPDWSFQTKCRQLLFSVSCANGFKTPENFTNLN